MENIVFGLEPQNTEAFRLNTLATMSEKAAKELVGRNIHFTWRNKKEKSIQTLPGKIISYEAGKVEVFTHNIVFEDFEDEKNNKMILTIPIDEIEDYVIFDDYTKEFWNLIEVIECDEDEQPLKKIYKVDNIFGESVECIIDKLDSFCIDLSYKLSSGDVVRVGYPLYFIKNIELKKFN